MDVYSLFGDDLEDRDVRLGYQGRARQIGALLGASLLGASLPATCSPSPRGRPAPTR